MSRLVSLYKSLSDEEILNLRNHIIRSEGISYLNSKDEGFLLKLACAEKIEEIDRLAMTVSRLGKRCSDPQLNQFEYVYSDLKDGIMDLSRLSFASKDIKKIVKQMEKFINATSDLYSGLEILAEMEVSEQRLMQWKTYARSFPGQKGNSDLFDQKIMWQRQQVRYLRQVSLWGQTFNKTVSLMTRTVCIVYTRISEAFAPYVTVLILPSPSHRHFFSEHQIKFYPDSRPLILSPRVSPLPARHSVSTVSGPISNDQSEQDSVRFWSRELKPLRSKLLKENRLLSFRILEKTVSANINNATCCSGMRLAEQAPASTVGGSGLAIRYANVILTSDRCMKSLFSIDEYTRDDLYHMLPAHLKEVVKPRLKKLCRVHELGKWEKISLVEDWAERLNQIFSWLTPMAQDTVKWQMERSFEKQNFDAKPKVLLLQTLYFSDRRKTERAIVDVLVGLSCICMCGSAIAEGFGFDPSKH
ncbi:hypothetical protein MKW94_012125 [Papaver nudicaule]|uniref:Uncharacterized protein n=1 Tax=Papaver nudicaule TaxID=74823 RepID=A0AA41SKP4_PAPNU|nr:hypothetical protein [Papaver nudicaule]